MMELFLNDNLGKISAEVNESPRAQAILILAHGAGAGMHHPFMHSMAQRLADMDITTIRFNFPYMEQGRKSPGSPKANIETWKMVAEYIHNMYPGFPVFLSGKSYGGRMASHLLSAEPLEYVKGIVYFGFPLHAPGKDSKDRADHLKTLQIPQLFLQGSNDKLANIHLIKEVLLELPNPTLEEVSDADHSFNVPKKSGKTKSEIMEFLSSTAASWIKDHLD
ncbi:hypothetical protein SAMN05421640_1114 [Ekhidna lutea]|uniref:KANL3/Tex30 alpha/beta hydrolase-like domain-containing protein n=1 Tax=Ekhidna lutea TaxID=447679 RepID=A0A239H5V3_EKHLU|nr:alpha/beta family hydrolase [Ekhidna lutea]SNS75654.1 hypothetical protein SAMN05421640_1114 [Ekhidna lutea]